MNMYQMRGGNVSYCNCEVASRLRKIELKQESERYWILGAGT